MSLLLALLLLPRCIPSAAAAAAAAGATAARTNVLLLVPIHASEPVSNVESFFNCTLAVPPFRGFASSLYDPTLAWLPSPVGVDLLVVVSGRTAAASRALRLVFRALAPRTPYVRRVFFEEVAVGHARYDRSRASADWTQGPNDVFYDAVAEGGAVHGRYTRRYTFLQQLETDVCAMRPGWLAAALAPMYDHRVVVSGSSLKGGCTMSADRQHPCFPAGRLAHAAVRYHLNGNALYRPGPQLRELAAAARANFSGWSFDVALWLAAEAGDKSDWLWDNQHTASPFVLAGAEPAAMRASLPAETYLAHLPRRFRGGVAEVRDWCAACMARGDPLCRAQLPASALCSGGGGVHALRS